MWRTSLDWRPFASLEILYQEKFRDIFIVIFSRQSKSRRGRSFPWRSSQVRRRRWRHRWAWAWKCLPELARRTRRLQLKVSHVMRKLFSQFKPEVRKVHPLLPSHALLFRTCVLKMPLCDVTKGADTTPTLLTTAPASCTRSSTSKTLLGIHTEIYIICSLSSSHKH